MITIELFILFQLFLNTNVSWYWGLLFIVADMVGWSRLERLVNKYEDE